MDGSPWRRHRAGRHDASGSWGDPKHWILVDDPLEVAQWRPAVDRKRMGETTTWSPVVQLRSAITALLGFLGKQPEVCAGLLSFAGATGRLGTLMAAKDAKLAAPLQKILDEGAATDQFTISDSRDAANAILGAALITTLTRWEDGRDTQGPEFQHALTDQLVRSVARA